MAWNCHGAVGQTEGAMKMDSVISDVKEENRVLLREKVNDQKTVINLQNQIIVKNVAEL